MSVKSVNPADKAGVTINEATSTIKNIAESVKENLNFQPPQVLYGPAPATGEIEELDLDEFDSHKIISDELVQHEQMKYGPPPASTEHSPFEELVNHEQMKYGPPPASTEHSPYEELVNHEQMKYGPPPSPVPHISSEIIENLSHQEQYKYGPVPNDIRPGNYKDKK